MAWFALPVSLAPAGVDPTLVVDWGARPWISLALVGTVAVGICLAGLVRSDRVQLPRRGRETVDEADDRLPRAEVEELEQAPVEELPAAEPLDEPPVPPSSSPGEHHPPLDVVRESNGHAPPDESSAENNGGSEG